VAQRDYLAKRLQGVNFVFSRETGDKATRAEPFAAQVNVGNVRMVKAPWNDALLNEFRVFPYGRHDDIVDACSRAYNELGKTWDYRGLL
jgi:predicted phage terminase large subunit-like protein